VAAYLDLPGYKQRSIIPSTDVDLVETLQPGFVEARLAIRQENLDARLVKRYAVPFASPVSEIVLGWLVALVDVDVMRKRGVNPQDPMMVGFIDEATRVYAEVKEAADSKEGLYELPLNDAQGNSGINHAGPLMYTEASPFVAADRQELQGRCEDEARTGTSGGT